ncbi:zinc ribbon domain-containing protein [Peptoniphilus vaginalis]|uniref:zinc ribbon domain-containing protein n=1 Tax=Peptoniphilus vaginalis TaxID=1756987 RepID=UPI0023F64B58|nr:zinc-ribbon domain-containing protein [Peptoniphilus vaginalis]
MKEGVTLFCPKCGNQVSKNDNFCASCGHNLKDVKINITSKNNQSFGDTNKVEKVSQNTRVFNPKSLDAIDTTDELKNIIAEVDRTISKNIKDYENNNLQTKASEKEKKSKAKPEEASEKNKNKKEKKNKDKSKSIDSNKFDENILDEFKDPDSSNKMSQKELVRRVQEELKKSSFDEKDINNTSSETPKSSNDETNKPLEVFEEEKTKEPPKKFSLKEKWKNFIKEDDDEYSIFGDLRDDTKKKEDTRNLEISKSVEDTDRSFENTLSTPKIDIENAIKEAEEEKSKQKKEKVNKNNSNKEKIEVKEVPKNSEVKEKSKNKRNLKDLFSFADKGEKPVKDIEEVSSKFEKSIEHNISEKVMEVTNKSDKEIDKLLDSLDKLTGKLSDYIGAFGSKESKKIIGLGILLNLIMLLIGSGTFKLILIPFLFLKIVFDYLEFYIPLNIATGRDYIDTSSSEVKKFALINWIICKAILFVGFLISPFGGFFNYNMIQALTPMPLATLIIIGLSLLIGLNLYKENFFTRSKINFVGWYAISFTLFELLFKMIWFIINFIFVTLF